MSNNVLKHGIQLTGLEQSQLFLPIDRIKPNPDHPRLAKNNDKLVSLGESIKRAGVKSPVLVCKDGVDFVLISGHRRVTAAIYAGLEEVPARILPGKASAYWDDIFCADLLGVGLNHLEKALYIGQLVSSGIAKEELCLRTGLKPSSISEYLGINRIPRRVCKELIVNDHTGMRFLIELSKSGDQNEISEAYSHYKKHNQLPERQKRGYKYNLEKIKLQALLEKLNNYAKRSDCLDYCADAEIDEKIRTAIVELQRSLHSKGWFVPSTFDTSNHR